MWRCSEGASRSTWPGEMPGEAYRLSPQRIQQLESDNKRQAVELQEQSKLSVERQEALLATIEALDERVASLELQLVDLQHSRGVCDALSDHEQAGGDFGHAVRNCESAVDSSVGSSGSDCAAAASGSLPTTVSGKATDRDVDGTSSFQAGGDGDGAATRVTSPAASESLMTSVSAKPAKGDGDVRIVESPKLSACPDALSRERDDSSWAGVAARGPKVSAEDGFQVARGKRRAVTVGGGKSGAVRRSDQGPSLKGAVRIHCLPFHLSGISLDSGADDVISHCLDRNVSITGCYLIRSRVWGTQSAKIFVDKNCKERVLEEGFWPDHPRCRVWEPDPPTRPNRNLDNPLQW